MSLKNLTATLNTFRNLIGHYQSQQLNRLVPRSHKFQTHISLSLESNKDQGLRREQPLIGTSQQTTHNQGGFSSE